MTKIIAIGGGEIGRPGTKVETLTIDKEIIRLSGKKNPRLLFIPTASGDSKSYYDVVKKHFSGRLKCKTDVLYLINETPSNDKIREKILNSDIVYVGGGNTLKMIKIWKKLGVDKILIEASKKGVVMSGVSAGAICWFQYGCSDSLLFTDKKAPMIRVKGLGLVKGLFCPHYDVEKKRKPALKNILKNTKLSALALDNCTAIEIVDDNYKILYSKKTAKVSKFYWESDKYIKKNIDNNNFSSLKDIYTR